ncbi:MAG: TIGR01906 family membrane protein [Aquificaceae bacterium]
MKVFLKVLLVVLFPLLLTLLSVRIAFTEAFVEFLYPRVELPQDPMPYELRLSIAKLGLRSVLTDKGMEELKNSGLFNEREIRHIEDVKRLLGFSFVLLYIGLPIFLLGLLSLREIKNIGMVLFFGSLLLEVFALFVLLSSVINYEGIFTAFHELFFDPHSWRFFEEDMLIRVYPMDFWLKATLYTTLMVFFVNLFPQALGLLLWRRRPS